MKLKSVLHPGWSVQTPHRATCFSQATCPWINSLFLSLSCRHSISKQYFRRDFWSTWGLPTARRGRLIERKHSLHFDEKTNFHRHAGRLTHGTQLAGLLQPLVVPFNGWWERTRDLWPCEKLHIYIYWIEPCRSERLILTVVMWSERNSLLSRDHSDGKSQIEMEGNRVARRQNTLTGNRIGEKNHLKLWQHLWTGCCHTSLWSSVETLTELLFLSVTVLHYPWCPQNKQQYYIVYHPCPDQWRVPQDTWCLAMRLVTNASVTV